MNQAIITIRFAHAPQCQMHGSCHSAIMAVRDVCIAAPFGQFSTFLGKLVYATYVKRMHNVVYAYIGIVKPVLCLYY